MPTTITSANSFFGNGKGFTGTTATTDSLTINAGTYLISGDSDGADLSGVWAVKVNGFLGALPTFGGRGLVLNATGITKTSTINVGADGEIGGNGVGLFAEQATNITVAKGGAITSASDAAIQFTGNAIGHYKITNAGQILGNGADGIILSGIGTHTIVNSGTINGTDSIFTNSAFGNEIVTNTGSLLGSVKLGAGNDSLTNSKLIVGDVRMGDDADTVTNSGTITGTVSMEAGNDILKNTGTIQGDIDMGTGDDQFFGGTKNEFVGDQDGADKYMLGGGNDIYFARGDFVTSDVADGGAGVDIYDASSSVEVTQINIDTVDHVELFNGKQIGQGSGQGKLTGASTDIGTDKVTGFENVWGGTNTDFIFGSASANEIFGFKGNDDLWGYGGNDKLEGGEGDDFLIGGVGRDELTGDAGADSFIFLTTAETGKTAKTRDLINDFEIGTDKIDLSHIDGDTRPSMAGDSPFIGFVALDNGFSAFTKAAGQLRQFWANGNTVIEGDVNGDGKADFQIELAGRHILTDTDFIL
jgi:hypothetical protein